MRTIRTLLSGGELFGVGARWAGYTHLDGYEIDQKIAAVARLNGFDVRTADICDIDYSSLPPADHLHASTVCTRASQANTGAVETDADLRMADAVCRAITAHKGRTFSLENVWAYRNFESFARILTALLEAGFVYNFAHVNAADYGVPQTRKRLILRAVRGRDRVPPLHPTHRKGGDMFHPPWVGWYSAIADILHTLPETKPAPWQLARMPKELRESTLIAQGAYGDRLSPADRHTPAFTVTANSNQSHVRALLLGDQSAGAGVGVQIADASAPAFTLRASDHNGHVRALLVDEPAPTIGADSSSPRAYIVGGGNTGWDKVTSHARSADEPMFTVKGSKASPDRAYLLDGDNAHARHGEPTLRTADEPAMTVRGSRTPAHRAYTAGRWVRMTMQALGRFQTVPDDYQGLTAKINGNGVPCLMAQRIMESLL